MEASSNPFFLFPLFIKPQEASLLKNKEVSFLLLQDCQSWARNIFLRQRQRDHIIEFLLQGKNPKNVTVSVSLIIWSEPIKVCTYLSWYIKLSIAHLWQCHKIGENVQELEPSYSPWWWSSSPPHPIITGLTFIVVVVIMPACIVIIFTFLVPVKRKNKTFL